MLASVGGSGKLEIIVVILDSFEAALYELSLVPPCTVGERVARVCPPLLRSPASATWRSPVET
jgi:hypothetical protein